MKVEIYSDVVCPWCDVGERRFARALAGGIFAAHLTRGENVGDPGTLARLAGAVPRGVRRGRRAAGGRLGVWRGGSRAPDGSSRGQASTILKSGSFGSYGSGG